jgi:hypothetical protein
LRASLEGCSLGTIPHEREADRKAERLSGASSAKMKSGSRRRRAR